MGDQIAEGCWWLHHERDMSIEEIAGRMSMSEGDVRAAIGRYKPRLEPGALNVSNNRVIMDYRVSARAADREAALARVVERDPCIGCGVRADKHDLDGCRRYIG